MLFFYFLSPVPTVISRRLSGSLDSSSSALIELCIFLTVGIVVSAVGLPIVLARTSVVCIIDKYMKIHFQGKKKIKYMYMEYSILLPKIFRKYGVPQSFCELQVYRFTRKTILGQKFTPSALACDYCFKVCSIL